jgi:hypothetical protein
MPFSMTAEIHSEDYWRKADVVVVDLTDANPNVYWELGVRQSFKHGTVTIAQAGTSLPFDVSVKGTLFYHPGDHLKNEEFRKTFRAAIHDCLSHPDRPDSHVLETISGRGSIYQLIREDEARRRVEGLLHEAAVNRLAIERVQDVARRNQQARDDKQNSKTSEPGERTTSRLRLVCLELLLATRYLELDRKVYSLASIYHSHADAFNSQLALWLNNPRPEQWLLKNGDLLKGIMSDLSRRLETVYGLEPIIVKLHDSYAPEMWWPKGPDA